MNPRVFPVNEQVKRDLQSPNRPAPGGQISPLAHRLKALILFMRLLVGGTQLKEYSSLKDSMHIILGICLTNRLR